MKCKSSFDSSLEPFPIDRDLSSRSAVDGERALRCSMKSLTGSMVSGQNSAMQELQLEQSGVRTTYSLPRQLPFAAWR